MADIHRLSSFNLEDLKNLNSLLLQLTSRSYQMAPEDFKKARRWVGCNVSAFPRAQYFVAELEKEIIGYALWSEKGG